MLDEPTFTKQETHDLHAIEMEIAQTKYYIRMRREDTDSTQQSHSMYVQMLARIRKEGETNPTFEQYFTDPEETRYIAIHGSLRNNVWRYRDKNYNVEEYILLKIEQSQNTILTNGDFQKQYMRRIAEIELNKDEIVATATTRIANEKANKRKHNSMSALADLTEALHLRVRALEGRVGR